MGKNQRRDSRVLIGIFGPIVVLLAVILFFQYSSYRTNKKRLEDQLFRQQDLITSMASGRMQAYFHEIVSQLENLGARMALSKGSSAPSEMMDETYDALGGSVDGVAFFDANGDKIHSVFKKDTLQDLPANARYEDFFAIPKQTTVPYISPLVKVQGGRDAVYISCPVRSSETGAFCGTLLAMISKPSFSKLCESISGISDQVRFIYFDQQSQQICVEPCCSSSAGTHRKELMTDTMKEEIVGGKAPGGKGGRSHIRVVYQPLQLEGYRWYMSSEMRMDSLDAMASEDLMLMATMSVLLLISLLGGGVYFSRVYMAKARAETEAERQSVLAANAGALAAEKDKLREVINTMPDGIMLLDEGGGILDANKKMREVLGVSEDGTLAQVATRAEGNDLIGPVEEPSERVIGGRTFKIIPESVKGAAAGNLKEVRILRDITVEKSLEQKKADLVEMITHDVKSPLTVIMGITGWFRDEKLAGGLSDEARSGVETIRRAAGRVIELMDNLLILSNVEGMRKLAKTPVNVNAFLGKALLEVSLEARQRNIKLDCSYAEHSPVVQMDETQMMRAVANLLSNAVKYTPEGGNVSVVARKVRDYVTISVSDTGPGISAKDLSHIFERRFRGKTVRHIPKGSGLGLTIVKAVVEAHGGAVDVVSEEGKGATFTLRLPLGMPEG
jgi:signal transduction histidine kinase